MCELQKWRLKKYIGTTDHTKISDNMVLNCVEKAKSCRFYIFLGANNKELFSELTTLGNYAAVKVCKSTLSVR